MSGKSRKSRILCICIVLMAALSAAASHAAAPTTSEDDFTSWLERYGAYDVLERQLADDSGDPQSILARAQALIAAHEPQSALQLLESQPGFGDPGQELERLWLSAQANRMLGNLPEAVFGFSQALSQMPPEDQARRVQGEPGLGEVWRDVWRQWFWETRALPVGEQRDALHALLERSLVQGRSLFAQNDFWRAAEAAMASLDGRAGLAPDTDAVTLTVLDADRSIIAKAFAEVSLGQINEARRRLATLSDSLQSAFWLGVLELAEEPGGEANASSREMLTMRGYVKPAAFLSGYWKLVEPRTGEKEGSGWQIHDPGLPSWAAFLGKLAALPVSEARATVQRELTSSLLTAETTAVLTQLSLAYAILEEDRLSVMSLVGDVPLTALPLGLKVSLLALLDSAPAELAMVPDAPSAQPARTREFYLLDALSQASGHRLNPALHMPFWATSAGADTTKLLAARPLDRLLSYGVLSHSWEQARTPELARRLGFLFPSTPQGTSALLFLAGEAGRGGAYQAASFFLERIDPEALDAAGRAEYLQSRGALEIELGKNREALDTYVELFELDKDRLPPLKQLKLALLAQQQGRLQWAQQVLQDLWRQRQSLTPAEQAEVLFWMGEGSQAMGQEDEALDSYLRVAWQYPEQNIWAVTAMYRAAIIYERRGRFEAASKLLNTVIKNADRESQKEAAQERLNAIAAKTRSGQESKQPATGWAYPF